MERLYSSNSNPIIQCGSTYVNGISTVTFPTEYTTPITTFNICITSNPYGDQGSNVVSLSIFDITLTNFKIRGWLKDGRSGQNGGSSWVGTVRWIAVIS